MSLLGSIKKSMGAVVGKSRETNHLASDRYVSTSPSNLNNKPFTPAQLAHLMGMDYERFKQLFPYRAFDKQTEFFINTESVGFGCELAPLSGANEDMINGISEMIKNKVDETVCVQIMMVGSNKVGPFIEDSLSTHRQMGGVLEELAKSQRQYLKHAAIKGFHNKRQMSMHLRDYRCFLFVSKKSGYSKKVAAELSDLRDDILVELGNIGIPSMNVDVIRFIGLLKDLINCREREIDPAVVKQDRFREIHEQIVDPSLSVRVHPTHIESEIEGQKKTEIVSLSLREMPDEVFLWAQPDNFSNIFRPNIGIPCSFVISVHFKCEGKEKSKMKAFRKASGYEKKAKSSYAKLIPGTTQAYADWKKVRDDLATDSIQLCKMYYNCTLFTDAENRRDHVSKTISAFRINGIDLYSIKYQQLQSYLALMPFVVEQGLWQDLSLLGRVNTTTTWTLSNMIPLVAEYKGRPGDKGVLSPTFRHQITSIDNFSPSLDNYNVCITGTSGSGKSVLSQSMISSVLADGGKVWVIDLGQSYKKFCETLGGTYLDASNLQLNPFSGVKDISQSAESIRDLIEMMASPNEGLSDVQKAYLLDAVNYAYKKNKQQANIDDVIEYLQEAGKSKDQDLRIKDIAVLLKKYSPTQSGGGSMASRIFNEASKLHTDHPDKERFVVLELGELESQPDLQKAVLYALILNIQGQMYTGDQNRKKMCVIDEAWRLLSGSNKTAASFITKGFRTGRKHNGAFVVITQHIKDFFQSLEALAAWACAETKIIMRQNEKAFKDFMTEHKDYFSPYEKELIQAFRSSAENGFSEFLVQQGGISRFHRLFLDPFARVMFSSKAQEQQAVKHWVMQGYLMAAAIRRVAMDLFGGEIKAIEEMGDG